MSELDSPVQDLSGADDTNPGAGSGSKLALALGAGGLILGAVALFLAYSQGSKIDAVEAKASDAAALAAEAQGLGSRIEELNGKVNQAGTLIGQMQRDMQAVRTVSTELQTQSRNIADNRKQINDLTTRLGELLTARPAPAAPRAEEPAAGGTTGAATAAAGSGAAAGTYTIRGGDTFAKLAKEWGLPLQNLLDANPGVNPSALRIGQVINVPRN